MLNSSFFSLTLTLLLFLSAGLSGSVAQTQVVKKLEKNINSDLDFLKMFKEGLGGNDD
jgi:hypothetical protein